MKFCFLHYKHNLLLQTLWLLCFAVQGYLAAGGLVKPRNQFAKGGFAAAVGSYKTDNFMFTDRKTDTGKRVT